MSFVAINPTYFTGVQYYEKIVIALDDIGAFGTIVNHNTHNLQRQSYIGGAIPTRVYHGDKRGGCRIYTFDDFENLPNVIGGLDDAVVNNLWICARYLWNSFTAFAKKYKDETEREISDETREQARNAVEKIQGIVKAEYEKRSADAKPISVEPIVQNVVTKEKPTTEERKQVEMFKMVYADFLYGFTNGNFYKVEGERDGYAILRNDFGIECKVKMERGKKMMVFIEPPKEKAKA